MAKLIWSLDLWPCRGWGGGEKAAVQQRGIGPHRHSGAQNSPCAGGAGTAERG